MNAVARLKTSLKRFVHASLQTPRRERALVAIARQCPAQLQPTLRKLVPQPRSYAASEERLVTRFGMQWHLHPSEYFQWHHYFAFADAVLETLQHVVHEGDCVLDIGANIGLYTGIVARKVGVSGRVHSFEPNPPTFQRLTLHVQENGLDNVHCHAIALGETEQDSVLNDFGGTDSGKSSLRGVDPGKAVAGVSVHVSALDSVVQRLALEKIDVVKIDVEGFEPEVLLGARATIASRKPLICLEWSPNWHAGREAQAAQALRMLESASYRCFEISSEPSSHGVLFERPWTQPSRGQNVLLVPAGSEHRLRGLRVAFLSQ
jgi:FkbM family methyltransferase